MNPVQIPGLNRLHQWSVAWLLNFHQEKCCTLKLGNSSTDLIYYMPRLGVIVDSELLWNSLPGSLVAEPSVNAFKNRGDAHWANQPAIFDSERYN